MLVLVREALETSFECDEDGRLAFVKNTKWRVVSTVDRCRIENDARGGEISRQISLRDDEAPLDK